MQPYKDRIVFFDFCETLVNFQTADAFIDYVRLKTNNKRMKLFEVVRRILIRSRILPISLYKKFKLYQLKGFEKQVLNKYAQSYYNDIIKPNLIKKTMSILLQKQKEGAKIVIVSGGYSIYLKFFAEDFGINKIISTEIDFHNNKCTGQIDGLDCMNKNKVMILNQLYKKNKVITEAYSDSVTDLPFLKWADVGVVVSKRHQCWTEDTNLLEILWD